MNEAFFNLPKSKQETIINAGFKVFSESSYKKSPVSTIADSAMISKSLLFYYFKNKKELYIYLWHKTIEAISDECKKEKTLDSNDYFIILRKTLKAKCNVMRTHPVLTKFALKAYYEMDKNIESDIQYNFNKANEASKKIVLSKIDRTKFKANIDFPLMYNEMMWAMDGYLRNSLEEDCLDTDIIEKDLLKLINLWELVYLK